MGRSYLPNALQVVDHIAAALKVFFIAGNGSCDLGNFYSECAAVNSPKRDGCNSDQGRDQDCLAGRLPGLPADLFFRIQSEPLIELAAAKLATYVV